MDRGFRKSTSEKVRKTDKGIILKWTFETEKEKTH